ncbi:MAG: hypothetical protein IH628_11880 [Proteobacteria bacterium]|nr:hypothetical protein [Pseudomonadota bacterium]
MTLRATVALGIRKLNRTKRMVVFAWILNVLVALVVAGPMLGMLDASIAPTVMEERLVERLDLNWIETFKADHPNNAIARMLGLSMLGAAPFYDHLNEMINGNTVKAIGKFFAGLLFEFKVHTELLDVGLLLVLVYILLWTYLSGGFIGVYSREHRSSFSEFLQLGARYFGKFFRLALIQLLVYFLLFSVLVDWASGNIRSWTSGEASEMTAYVYFMLRNVLVLFLIGFLSLGFDYAKVRMVVDSRVSSLAAFGAGFRFVVTHPVQTVALGLLLAALGVVFAGVFVLLEGKVVQSSFWMILLLFILQQIYVWSRQLLRAAYYATETSLYQGYARETGAEKTRGDVVPEPEG